MARNEEEEILALEKQAAPALILASCGLPAVRGLRRGQRAYVLNWLFKARGSGHAPDSIAVSSGASANSHDRCRHAFGHVICADVDALQARPSSNGR